MPWIRFLALGLLAGMLAAKLEVAGGILLIRPIRVYESLIRGVHDYFNNTCIILLHGKPNPMDSEELEQVDGLLALQRYLSAGLNIRTAIMDLKTFQTRVGKTYRRIKRPLFVLLNDLEEVEEQFVLVSDWIAMAYPTWLVILREQTAFEDFLSRVHVPFDCLLMVAQTEPGGTGEIVRDVYRIDRGGELRSMYFGSWDEVRGFRGPLTGFYQRRNNLYGHNLRIASIDNSPVSWLVRNSLGETIDVRGFFGQVLRLLREGMNCTFTYESAPAWGVRLTNGSWTGLIGALLNGHADLAATELMMTSDRMDVVRFTTPVYSTRCRTYIKRPESMAVKWNAYAAPFAAEIWKFVGLLVAVVAATIAGIKAFLGSRAAAEFPRDSDRAPSNFLETAFYVFGAFCGQGMEPSSLDPVRLVELSVHLTAVVIVAAYSAALISFLAVKTFVMPFATMRGLLEDGTYRFAVVAESADYSFFQNTTDEVMAVMFDELLRKEEDLPRTYLDGLRRVCEESKYAFMTMDTMAAVLRDKVDCILEPLDAIMQTTIAMATPTDSPYGGIINSNILLLRDSGILQRLLRLEWLSETSTATSQWASVELEDVAPLLVFLLLAFSLTWLLLLLERIADRLGRNRFNATVGNVGNAGTAAIPATIGPERGTGRGGGRRGGRRAGRQRQWP